MPSPPIPNPLTIRIKSIGVSMDIAEKVYGTGNSVHSSVNAWIDDQSASN
jgi:hypothetical protein